MQKVNSVHSRLLCNKLLLYIFMLESDNFILNVAFQGPPTVLARNYELQNHCGMLMICRYVIERDNWFIKAIHPLLLCNTWTIPVCNIIPLSPIIYSWKMLSLPVLRLL